MPDLQPGMSFFAPDALVRQYPWRRHEQAYLSRQVLQLRRRWLHAHLPFGRVRVFAVPADPPIVSEYLAMKPI